MLKHEESNTSKIEREKSNSTDREREEMGRERKKNVLKGCIKASKGPWVVRRSTKDGGVVTKYRFPSEKEREKNQEREKRRREVASKIFAGLRAHGNYNLPKHADSNDLLMALCREAGWHVHHDGTIFRHCQQEGKTMPSLVNAEVEDYEEYCKCGDGIEGDPDTTLTLSL